ncbi:hypothetical protein SV7mr_26550 [Stieleria bergensis]|uniref:Uncharacterized protein n=1 Tax=Stieleria bergensis TaxID=2528025 RepID=A0A517SVJ6_9BACT|nr:hypothetical protein SV7mr_26550 [Planctomycetes bacterium SV_7m_r]
MKKLAQQVVDKAERAVDQLRDRSNDTLDYSESSLAVVDEILVEASDFLDETPEAHVDALVRLLGSYVLEVGRRAFGGIYYWYEDRDQPVLVIGEPDYRVAILAFDKIRGRLSGNEAANIPLFYRGMAKLAGDAKPGTDVLYD